MTTLWIPLTIAAAFLQNHERPRRHEVLGIALLLLGIAMTLNLR